MCSVKVVESVTPNKLMGLIGLKYELNLLKIASNYGTICEKVIGPFGAKVVLEYGEEGWPLEVEISNQYWGE